MHNANNRFLPLFHLFLNPERNSAYIPEMPFRAELYNHKELILLGKNLAKEHKDRLTQRGTNSIYKRFEDNQGIIDQIYNTFYKKVLRKDAIPPGAEWLLDNYYIICEQIREIKKHLPKDYYKQLPKLDLKDLPRIYHLATEYIAHTDALVDAESLSFFVAAYQEISELKIGELWAVPIMLRMALIENLRRTSQSIRQINNEQEKARGIIKKILENEKAGGTDILLRMVSMIKQQPDMLNVASVYLIKELRGLGKGTNLAEQWVTEKLKEGSCDPESLIHLEEHLQAGNQITIGNTIRSLKNMGSIDWHEWFEEVSLVDQVLVQDPDGLYQASDFTTRDRARKEIESIARSLKTKETEIAKKLLDFKQQQPDQKLMLAYLITDEKYSFRGHLGCKTSLVQGVKNFFSKYALKTYLIFIWIPSLLMACLLAIYLSNQSAPFWTQILSLLSIFIFTEIFIQLIHWYLILTVSPKAIAKLDSELPVNSENKTVVIISTILKSKAVIDEAIEAMEVRFLANDDPSLSFAILADLPEASQEILPNDQNLLDYAEERILRVHKKYHYNQEQRLFLFFRKRCFSKSENKYMGWERKRGKISEFNHYLLTGEKGSFIISEDKYQFLQNTKYVITLDADTILPINSAKKLISAIAHPLNHPVINPETKTVRSGYAIMQPLMLNSLSSINISGFSKLISADTGIDPYSSLVSEVYQDIFQEGTFIGKGIYDLKAFDSVLEEKVPEEALLSHDLFEGNLLRCALISDISLVEHIPSKYNVEMSRQHRWTRGDWQLLPWLGLTVPDRERKKIKNPVSAIGLWKIIDNLRRSLMPLVYLASFILCLCLPREIRWLSAIPFTALGISLTLHLLDLLFRLPFNKNFFLLFGNWLFNLIKNLQRLACNIAFLPAYAVLLTDAIIKTIYRVYISKKNMLEWMTADFAEKNLRNDLLTYTHFFWANYLSVILLSAIFLYNQNFLTIPLSLLWLIAPVIAWKISQPYPEISYEPDKKEQQLLLDTAYKNWQFFRKHLTAEFNYLIPDNLQLVPERKIAERTSPTNIGFSMLATLAAYDLGFITLKENIALLKNIFTGIKQLETFSGNLFNWYNPRTLEPLAPRYISFVDSSNFLSYCITLKQSLKEMFVSPCIKSTEHEITYQTIKKQIKHTPESEAALFFKELIPWFDPLISMAIEVKDSDTKEKLESVIKILKSKTPNLTLTKKINNRLIDLNLPKISELARNSNQMIDNLANDIRELIRNLNNFINHTDFSFLYNKDKNVFAIGYNLDSASIDHSYYDLLASEARLGSLSAIALGQAPVKHWFSLGRNLCNTAFGKALYSWTGTTFEYLLPNLLSKDFHHSLLTESNFNAVKTQIRYARLKGVPWGMSESAHAGVDYEQTYQYRAFGVPDLGLKRGLGNDLVISPYSSFLSLPYAPGKALKNLQRLRNLGAFGEYGFYESIDYTRERLGKDEKFHLVETFFAHHQGMILLSINNFLNKNIFQNRFHSDPRIKSVELLLHEKFPLANAETIESTEPPAGFLNAPNDEGTKINRQIFTPFTKTPVTHIISNGEYSVLADNAGNSRSFVNGSTLMNAWQENPAIGAQGTFIYLKDLNSKYYWTNTFQPSCVKPDYYEVNYLPDKIEYKRTDKQIACHTEITVSPEFNLEIRKLNITNLSNRKRTLQVSSLMEVALAKEKDFQAHPAFVRTFVKSHFEPELDALIFERKPGRPGEQKQYMFHQLSMPICWDKTYYESDREALIGRYGSLNSPKFINQKRLQDNAGAVLDPVASLQTIIEITPGFSASLCFITGYASSKEEAYNSLRLFHHQNAINRSFDLAWSKCNIEIRNEHFSIRQVHNFQQIAGAIFYNNPTLIAEPEIRAKNKLTQSALWRFGISGDRPILLLLVNDSEQIKTVREMLLAHDYLRRRGVISDLVILNSATGGYFREFYQTIEETILSHPSGQFYQKDSPETGGVFLRDKNQLSEEELTLLQTIARVVINASRGSLKKHMQHETENYLPPEASYLPKNNFKAKKNESILPTELYNGVGGFNNQDYYLKINANSYPPLPWINVIANPDFGCLVSESGSGFTWSENSRENRISTWSNDPVKDPVSEAIYLREVLNGDFWSLTPKPCSNSADYLVKHSFGYSEFKNKYKQIQSDLKIYVAKDRNIKYFDIHLKNNSTENKTIELYFYTELLLGINRSDTYRHIITDYKNNALFAHNPYNNEFAERVAFFSSNETIESYTSKRYEFIGRQSTPTTPMFLIKTLKNSFTNLVTGLKGSSSFSNFSGLSKDPAIVFKVSLELKAGIEKNLVFFMGEETNQAEAEKTVEYCMRSESHTNDFQAVTKFWQQTTKKIEVKTPSKTFDTLVNGWLTYQNLSCRMFGRSAFYQSGGALGFRDQLQDSMALLYIDPSLTRKQIILHASRQFTEGDVQHWWHPPTGRGVRTKISDDLLWLPYTVAEYLKVTGDNSILEETAPYLQAEPLTEEQHDAYLHPEISEETGTILDHCFRAIDYSLKFGANGMPLIKGGDWNDGMDEVGKDGKGESVWLGWFLGDILNKFIPLLENSHPEKANTYQEHLKNITDSIEKNAWDGNWYLRAIYDDGTPLGSHTSEECKIDSLSQSWSVISGLGDPKRAETALEHVYKQLVDEKNRIIKLLTPAFDKTTKTPGYISGYLPGVRENGAQYTHAASWVILASAMLNKREQAFKLFQLINPVDITSTKEGMLRYKGEPYATCGDVLSNPQHAGRAGWSWYTGSAGWLYRVAIEHILGIKIYPDRIEIKPCVPKEWDEEGFEVVLRLEEGKERRIEVKGEVVRVDGERVEDLCYIK